jgi:23S rRNA (uracil1939-C5)-methyltransferase
MSLKKGQQLELQISKVAYGGKGLARVDGMAVFVDQTVPQDRVRARIVRKKKNYAEARVESYITYSPHRVKPPCPYSGYCGGCKWQFLSHDMQIVYKRQHVLDALEHIALMSDIPVSPTIPSEQLFEYRNKMEFTCSDRRWLLPDELSDADADSGFALGLHVPGTFYKVLDIGSCLLQPETGNRILNDVRDYMKKSKAPCYNLRGHTGFWRFLVLRHSVAYDQWLVNIVTAAEDRNILQPLAERLTATYPEVISVINNVTSRKAGVAVGEYEIRLSGAPVLKDRIGPFEFEISANSFFQTNTPGAKRLYDTIKDLSGLSGTETVLDLYSGTGTIAIYLSKHAGRVVGVEITRQGISDAEHNRRINRIDNCRFIQGDIRYCLGQIDVKPDLVIVDPPRAGMHKDVVKQILDMAPETIVYVSCNPASMARDLGMLKDSYQPLAVQPVDLFPHTFHIESVALLKRRIKGVKD